MKGYLCLPPLHTQQRYIGTGSFVSIVKRTIKSSLLFLLVVSLELAYLTGDNHRTIDNHEFTTLQESNPAHL